MTRRYWTILCIKKKKNNCICLKSTTKYVTLSCDKRVLTEDEVKNKAVLYIHILERFKSNFKISDFENCDEAEINEFSYFQKENDEVVSATEEIKCKVIF